MNEITDISLSQIINDCFFKDLKRGDGKRDEPDET